MGETTVEASTTYTCTRSSSSASGLSRRLGRRRSQLQEWGGAAFLPAYFTLCENTAFKRSKKKSTHTSCIKFKRSLSVDFFLHTLCNLPKFHLT